MKIRLAFDYHDGQLQYKCGSVLNVSDADGAALIAQGHTEVHPDTPSRINPELYTVGCVPVNPFSVSEPDTTLQADKPLTNKRNK